MCEKCVRKLKHVGYPKGKYGKIKFWAHRFNRPFGECPVFIDDTRLNIGIEAHLHKIFKKRTSKKIYRRESSKKYLGKEL